MMILSQDGKKIISTDNMNYIQFEEKAMNYKSYVYIITANFTKEQTLLGEYKTYERAKEILEDMYKQLKIQNFSFTYEMPKE
jgi:hypothetical protein